MINLRQSFELVEELGDNTMFRGILGQNEGGASGFASPIVTADRAARPRVKKERVPETAFYGRFVVN